MSTLKDVLRQLPTFPDVLPQLDVDTVPDDPGVLFRQWLDEAIASGARQPSAMTFMTTRADGTPVGRTLIVKDVDERGYQFSTHRSSRKGIEISENARASMLFFCRESGRQVRITGTVVELSAEESQRDWEGRPNYTGEPNPDWQLYALEPDEFEFLQAKLDRNHTRMEYVRQADGSWTHALVTTPAG